MGQNLLDKFTFFVKKANWRSQKLFLQCVSVLGQEFFSKRRFKIPFLLIKISNLFSVLGTLWNRRKTPPGGLPWHRVPRNRATAGPAAVPGGQRVLRRMVHRPLVRLLGVLRRGPPSAGGAVRAGGPHWWQPSAEVGGRGAVLR